MKELEHLGSDRLEALSEDTLSRSRKNKLKSDIITMLISLGCILVGLIYPLIFPNNQVVAPLFYTIGFLVEGIPVFISAVKGVFTRDMTNAMEILVAIAILACYLSGEHLLSVLIPLILNLAHLLEERSLIGGREIIDGLKKMQQSSAVVLRDGEEVRVDVRKLKIGETILVRPGMAVPIDGVVITGESHVDQKSLTGEPEPVFVKPGDNVYAGTVNLDTRMTIRVSKEFIDTSFSHILSFLEKAEKIAVPESRLIDRFMWYYIPFVLAIAGAVALFSSDFSKAIAILVVSCPCGHMLVSSAPMIAALSAATKRGILIKNSKFIEELNVVDTVVLDKTGTITEGNLTLSDVIYVDGETRESVLKAASIPAGASNHPISKAVVEAVSDPNGADAYEIREHSGQGMEAVSKTNGETILFGNRGWFETLNLAIPDEVDEKTSGSVSYVARNGVLLGALCFKDRAKPGAKEVLDDLKSLGVKKVIMLTGDREAAAKEIAEETGVDEYKAQLLPEDKLNAIRAAKEDSKVLAVGDGINDALALKEADVGIAMGAMGTDLAIQSSDIALMNDRLENIPASIRIARKTRRIIYQNLVLSLSVSAVMILLSIFGVISPLAGAILHNIGAFSVILNSSRILGSDLKKR